MSWTRLRCIQTNSNIYNPKKKGWASKQVEHDFQSQVCYCQHPFSQVRCRISITGVLQGLQGLL